MALLGYARVSTSHQKLTSQITELNTAGVRDDRVFTDMMSGATDEREGLQRLLARAEKDDIILCTKMDRLGRNTADMIRIVDTCYKKGIAIRFLENGLREGANKQVISSQADSLIKISRIWADFFPANTSNQPI